MSQQRPSARALTAAIRTAKSAALDLAELLLPGPCPACSGRLPGTAVGGVCPACWAELEPVTDPACEACDLPLVASADASPQLCDRCGAREPPLPVRAALVYRERAVRLHRLLKFEGLDSLVPHLAARMVAALRGRGSVEADLVVPVPADPLRWGPRCRVSLELARHVALALGLPLEPRGLAKRRSTRPQTRRTHRERERSLRGSMRGRERPLRGRRVLVIDDVATTLATLAEASRAIRGAGGEPVQALVLARTPIGEDEA